MQGPEFHEFLIRAGNDRLLTDREHSPILGELFVEYTNMSYDLNVAAAANNNEGEAERALEEFQKGTEYGVARAPLELIAHVVENDLPYTDILTADYIMANAITADAYGADTEFADTTDVHDFQPSRIVSYYREDDSMITEDDPQFGLRILDPGNLATVYPHAGVLNTTAFMKRYPSTATNRNRARSRWTYYHFLGLDVEKSASRTTDPVALADTNNPTMHNPACTVCHVVLDPVAGAFQNYGDDGHYRDQWGGMDALDGFYKEGAAPIVEEVEAETYESRETVSATVRLSPGGLLGVQFVNDYYTEDSGADRNLFVDRLVVREEEGGAIFTVELEDLTEDDLGEGDCGLATHDTHFGFYSGCRLRFDVDVPVDARYTVEAVAWADQHGDELAQIAFWGILYREGDTWYRDMREPGFDGELVPNADNSLPWVAEQIVADPRFAEATVKFWWPAIMGRDVAEPPEDENDADFEGHLLASNAQTAEVKRLARGFRRGFRGGSPYNLKDLLVEMVLSRWFRAESIADPDAVRSVALGDAGARRLLTPEELARKTLAITGFQWGRVRVDTQPWRGPAHEETNLLADIEQGYGLLYGGIDSDGVTDRARDFTSVMAGVAQTHALRTSCPVVMKDLYLLPDGQRRLFSRSADTVSPAFEFSAEFEIEASADTGEMQTVSARGKLRAGSLNVVLAFLNGGFDEATNRVRHLRLDRLDVRAASGELVATQELEDLPWVNEQNRPWGPWYWMRVTGALRVPVAIPRDGEYEIVVVTSADQAGDELARLEVIVESETQGSVGAKAIRNELAALFDRLLGMSVTAESPDVQAAYDLFVDVWERGRGVEDGELIECDWRGDQHYLDGIVDDAFVWRDDWEWGEGYWWDWDRISPHFNTIDWFDPHGVEEAWTVVLAYLLMDYRYLYL